MYLKYNLDLQDNVDGGLKINLKCSTFLYLYIYIYIYRFISRNYFYIYIYKLLD